METGLHSNTEKILRPAFEQFAGYAPLIQVTREMTQAKQETLWVLRAQAGDREALGLLLQAVQSPLFRYIASLTLDHHVAEDIELTRG